MSIQISEQDSKIIALRGSEEVAFAKIVPDNKNSDYLYLSDVFVKEMHRRQGIASQVLDYLEEKTPHGIKIEVDEDNTAAVNLYKNRGYKIDKTVTSKNGKTYLRMSWVKPE